MVITWSDSGDDSHLDPEQASYVCNGKRVGTGRRGFDAVLARLRSLPEGSDVCVYPDYVLRPIDGQDFPLSGERLMSVPFRATEELHRQFMQAVRARSLHVWCASDDPHGNVAGQYVPYEKLSAAKFREE